MSIGKTSKIVVRAANITNEMGKDIRIAGTICVFCTSTYDAKLSSTSDE